MVSPLFVILSKGLLRRAIAKDLIRAIGMRATIAKDVIKNGNMANVMVSLSNHDMRAKASAPRLAREQASPRVALRQAQGDKPHPVKSFEPTDSRLSTPDLGLIKRAFPLIEAGRAVRSYGTGLRREGRYPLPSLTRR